MIVGTAVPYYLESGVGGDVVLMLHGLGGGHQSFAGQMPAVVEAGFRAGSWDMPGYGYSRTVVPYTFESLSQACLDLVEVIDATRLILVGHGLGGMVAQEVVARWPDRVHGLVLVATSAAFDRPDARWRRDFIAARTTPLDAGASVADLAADLVQTMVGRNTPAETIAAARATMSAVPVASYRHALGALLDFERRAALTKIRIPTLLIAGAQDPIAPPRVLEEMAAAIHGAYFLSIENCGHLVNQEQPDAFNRVLGAYLKQHFRVT